MSDKPFWVVVILADGGSFIGGIDTRPTMPGEPLAARADAARECLKQAVVNGTCIRLAPCYKFIDNVQAQSTPQGMALSRNIMALPIGAQLSPEDSDMTTRISGYYLVTHVMNSGDQASYEELINNANKLASNHRAERSGLQVPGMPPGQRVQ